MNQINKGWNLGDFITGVALVVTTDQWVGAVGFADPWKLSSIPFTNIILDQPFSFMAAARGIAIVLAVAYALRKLRTLADNKKARRMRNVIISGVIAMLIIETLVITPYTMATLAETPTGKGLTAIWYPLFVGWAMLASGMTLGAVALSAAAGLVIEKIEARKLPRDGEKRPVGRPPRYVPAQRIVGNGVTKHQRDERKTE